MSLDKLTAKFQSALSEAQSIALGQDHGFIEPEHLMKALLEQNGGSVYALLTKAKVNVGVLKKNLDDAIGRLPKVSGMGGEIHVSNQLAKLLNLTDKLAQKHGDAYISSEFFV